MLSTIRLKILCVRRLLLLRVSFLDFDEIDSGSLFNLVNVLCISGVVVHQRTRREI